MAVNLEKRGKLKDRIPDPFTLRDIHNLKATIRAGELDVAGATIRAASHLERRGHSLVYGENGSLYHRGPKDEAGSLIFESAELMELTQPLPSNRMPEGFTEKDVYELRQSPSLGSTDHTPKWVLDVDSEVPRIRSGKNSPEETRDRAMVRVLSRGETELGMDCRGNVFSRVKGGQAHLVYLADKAREIIREQMPDVSL